MCWRTEQKEPMVSQSKYLRTLNMALYIPWLLLRYSKFITGLFELICKDGENDETLTFFLSQKKGIRKRWPSLKPRLRSHLGSTHNDSFPQTGRVNALYSWKDWNCDSSLPGLTGHVGKSEPFTSHFHSRENFPCEKASGLVTADLSSLETRVFKCASSARIPAVHRGLGFKSHRLSGR